MWPFNKRLLNKQRKPTEKEVLFIRMHLDSIAKELNRSNANLLWNIEEESTELFWLVEQNSKGSKRLAAIQWASDLRGWVSAFSLELLPPEIAFISWKLRDALGKNKFESSSTYFMEANGRMFVNTSAYIQFVYHLSKLALSKSIEGELKPAEPGTDLGEMPPKKEDMN